MRETIFGIVFVTSLIFDSVNCQKPEWQTPADSSQHTLNLADSKACTGTENVLSQIVKAKSTTSETVFYRIVSQSPNDGAFVLGFNFIQDQIVICVKDKVVSPSYDVVLGAFYKPRDENNEATITVKISLQGLAETKPPVFTKPDSSKDDHVINMPESIQPGEDVIKLEAKNDDDSTGSTFTFNMDNSSVSTRQLFEIKKGTDILKVRDNVTKDYFDVENLNTESSYPIVLEVSNGRGASSLSTQIHVNDVNDNAPEFSGNFQASIPGNSKEGYTVLTLNVTDNDKTSPNNAVTLSLSGADEFELNGTDIVVAQGANFASNTSEYTLTVVASDNAPKDSKSTRQQVIVKIQKEPTGSANKHDTMMSTVLTAFFVCLIIICYDSGASLLSF